MHYIIIISFTTIFGFGLYIYYQLYKIKVKKQLEKEEELERLARVRALKEQKRLRLEYEHRHKLYALNAHRVRLRLFNARKDLNNLIYLYDLVVIKNYWVSEPFYSKFYELLLIFENNNFMIIDPNAKVVTMHLRDHNNEVQMSRAFEVYSSRDIVESIIRTSMKNILKFNQQDAQNIVIAICILIFEKSVHYLSQEASKKIIIDLLDDYESEEEVRKIVELIREKNASVKFIFDAFEQALDSSRTYPYNDSEVPKKLQLPQKLPQKFFQEF